MSEEADVPINKHDTLVKLGTLSHNRSFTRRDWYEYGGTRHGFNWLRRNKLIAFSEKSWYPTTTGWAAVDGAAAGKEVQDATG